MEGEGKDILIIDLRGKIRLVREPALPDPLEVWIPLPLGGVRERLEDPELQELVRSLPEGVLVGRRGNRWEVEFTEELHQTLQVLREKLGEKGGKDEPV